MKYEGFKIGLTLSIWMIVLLSLMIGLSGYAVGFGVGTGYDCKKSSTTYMVTVCEVDKIKKGNIEDKRFFQSVQSLCSNFDLLKITFCSLNG